MTAEQMKYEFDVGYDRITNFDAPGYVPKEISTFLTRSQEEIVHEILDKMSANDEKNRKALSKLRQVIPLSTFTAGSYPNGFSAPLQAILVGGTVFSFQITGNYLSNSTGQFLIAGFRVGDTITVTGATSSNNNKDYVIVNLSATIMEFSDQTVVGTTETGQLGTQIVADPVLRVRNERADILLTTNFYYNRIPVVPATVPVTYNNNILDVEVDPVDDDFYSANKSNPYKKPSIEKIWRIDSADESSKEHEYITDGTFTLTTVHLHIDRKPRPIIVPETTDINYATTDGTIDGIWFSDYSNVLTSGARDGLDCLLDPITHRAIVDNAVKLAYAALQDEKGFQISTVQERQE